MKGGLFLDVVIQESTTVLQLYAGENIVDQEECLSCPESHIVDGVGGPQIILPERVFSRLPAKMGCCWSGEGKRELSFVRCPSAAITIQLSKAGLQGSSSARFLCLLPPDSNFGALLMVRVNTDTDTRAEALLM